MKDSFPNIRFFFLGLLFSLPIFWGANLAQKNLEETLFWDKVAFDPSILSAQASQEIELAKILPVKKTDILPLDLKAESAISFLVKKDKSQKVLFRKEADKPLPIASLTKLMTALVVLENYKLSQMVEIDKQAAEEEGKTGFFRKGEVFSVRDLLYSSLIESSNDSVVALVDLIGEEGFVDLMNSEAKRIGLKNTYFFNPTGLDPDADQEKTNLSTARDLAVLARYLFEKEPFVWETSLISQFDLYTPNGIFHHKIINTNELLKEIPGVLGGKTGWTPQAKGCLLLIVKAPKNNGIIINVVLGSPDRFGEMKKLIQWVKDSYKW